VPPFRCERSICNVGVSESLVLQKLCALKNNKAPGPENIHPIILKACAHTLCTLLTLLFHQFLTSGDLPSDWKEAHVILEFKKGSRLKANNYRPISLTSAVVKILKSTICAELLYFFY